jgi:hypothetical protein
MPRFFSVVCLLLTAAVIAGCSAGAPTVIPLAPQHLYVNTSNAKIFIFNLPLTSLSTSSGNLNDSANDGICMDGQGKLYVPNGTVADVYMQPILSGNSASFVLTNGLNGAISCAADPSGNLYFGDGGTNNRIDVYQGPVGASSVRTSTITGVPIPLGVTTDASGNVFSSSSDNSVHEWSSLGAGNTATATFAAPVANFWDVHIGPDGNLYVANRNANGSIDVYTPSQFHNGTTSPDHSIVISGAIVLYLAFDRNANLYASGTVGPQSNIWVFAPPYTGPPTVVPLPASINVFGLVIGP